MNSLVFVFLLFGLVVSVRIYDKTIYVTSVGSDSTGDGSYQKAFATVQKGKRIFHYFYHLIQSFSSWIYFTTRRHVGQY